MCSDFAGLVVILLPAGIAIACCVCGFMVDGFILLWAVWFLLLLIVVFRFVWFGWIVLLADFGCFGLFCFGFKWL